MTGLGLIDLELHDAGIVGQVVVVQLDVRVDSHAAPPHEQLVLISQSQTVVVAEAEVLDHLLLARALKEDLFRSLHNFGRLLPQSELAVVVIAPCEHCAFTCEQTSKHIATGNLRHGDVEINHVRDRGHFYQLLNVCLCELIPFDFVSVASHDCHAAHDNVCVLCLVVDAMEQCANVARSDIIDNTVKHLLVNRA